MVSKKVILTYLHIVGVRHHLGRPELPLNQGYMLKREPTNQFDPNALQVTERTTGQVVAYMSRGSARLLRPIWQEQLAVRGQVYVKTKSHAYIRNRKPTQLCSVGFYTDATAEEKVSNCFRHTGLGVKII